MKESTHKFSGSANSLCRSPAVRPSFECVKKPSKSVTSAVVSMGTTGQVLPEREA